MNKVYEVYICRFADEVLYIGQGVKGRHKHCNSGCSHVYELNSFHFIYGSTALTTFVVKEFNDKSKAVELEKKLILKFVPKFNKVMMPNNKTLEAMTKAKEVKTKLKNYVENYNGLTDSAKNKYLKLVDELLGYHGYISIVNRDLSIYSKQHYKELKLSLMSNFATHIRHPRKNTNHLLSAHGILESCLVDCFNIDLSKQLANKIPLKVPQRLNDEGESQ